MNSLPNPRLEQPLKALVACLVLSGASCASSPRTAQSAPTTPAPPTFEVDGKPLCFAGSNNYYPIYKPKPVVDDLFEAARGLGIQVMRVWGMLDRGSLDGSVPSTDGEGHKQGVYFQYWDTEQQRPAYNDGEDGLQRLDYVLAAAAKNDVKVIVVLLNNWRAFGGIDQYLTWYGRNKHHEFFSAPELRQAYRDWVKHVITRTNTVNRRPYREDPAIFGWELANEPRCKGGGAFDSEQGWDKRTVTVWAHEMSGYIKSLDDNHLVSVGDEGFLDGGFLDHQLLERQTEHWAYRANDGVDHAALTALPNIDFGTFHLYPDDWQTPPGFAKRWILDHLELAGRLGKPTVLEEYGVKVARSDGTLGEIVQGLPERLAAYRSWNELLLRRGGASLSWMLVDNDGQARYPDHDGFAFYRDDATGKLLGDYAQRFVDAPACRATPASSTRPPSPFVRVRR